MGEVKSADEFYSYDAKYKNGESKTIIPAEISKEQREEVRQIAQKAFKAIDFFLEEKTNEIYLNEINTMPGFTTISMYPMLFEKIGINYTKLLDKLIEISLKK